MRWWQLTFLGCAVALSLWSAGFVIVQEAARNRDRADAICTQVTELREDLVASLESRSATPAQTQRVREVSC